MSNVGKMVRLIGQYARSFAEKKAERLLKVLRNLTESITNDIASISPEYSFDED